MSREARRRAGGEESFNEGPAVGRLSGSVPVSPFFGAASCFNEGPAVGRLSGWSRSKERCWSTGSRFNEGPAVGRLSGWGATPTRQKCRRRFNEGPAVGRLSGAASELTPGVWLFLASMRGRR